MIGIWQEFTQCGDAWAAMCAADNISRIKSALPGPVRPDTFYGRGGIHQDSI